MEEPDNISEIYRREVDKLLDDQSALNQPDQLSRYEVDQIWGEVSAEIDIGEVWNGISSELSIIMPEDSGSGFIYRSLAVLLILLCILIPGIKDLSRSPDNQISDIEVMSAKDEQSVMQITGSEKVNINEERSVKIVSPPADGTPIEKSNYESKVIAPTGERTVAEQTKIISSGDELVSEQTKMIRVGDELISRILDVPEIADSGLIIPPGHLSTDRPDIPMAIFPGDFKIISLTSKADPDSLRIHSPDRRSSAGSAGRGLISAGLIASFRNTWLLNNETFDGLRSESLNTTKFVFFPDAGICLNYSLNRTWLIQADAFFLSNTGQKYYEYISGHYSLKRITLRYSTVAVSVKHKFMVFRKFSPGTSVNILAGAYIAVLQDASLKINATPENITSQYQAFDLGVRVGGEAEVPVSGILSVAPGLSFSYGIPNIYKGSGNIPGYLRATHNGNAEFHLTFYYHFK